MTITYDASGNAYEAGPCQNVACEINPCDGSCKRRRPELDDRAPADPDTDEARLARMRRDCAVVHPDVAAEQRAAKHAAVRKVLQHHGLTKVGDGVIEADLIAALDGIEPKSKPLDLADQLEWSEKGLAEWRDAATKARREARMVDAQARIAIGHLQAVLNKARTHAEQQAADTAARDWLTSIGSEPN